MSLRQLRIRRTSQRGRVPEARQDLPHQHIEPPPLLSKRSRYPALHWQVLQSLSSAAKHTTVTTCCWSMKRRRSSRPREACCDSQAVSISTGSIRPLILLAHRTCGIRRKTCSPSVLAMKSCHSLVAIHSSLARLSRNFMNITVSWTSSGDGLGLWFDQAGAASGIVTGYVANFVTSGECEACMPNLATMESNLWVG